MIYRASSLACMADRLLCVRVVHARVCIYGMLQRLEVELKQSYSTKNYAVKSGLLEVEKKWVMS